MEVAGMPGHLVRRLHQISTQVFVARARAAGCDITPVQFAALDALLDHPGIDQASVAALIAADRATIGGVIDRLVAKGLVARMTNNRDRRARELHLTSSGEQAFTTLLPLVRTAQDEVVRGLSDEERDVLMRLLEKAIMAGSALLPAAEA